MFTLPWWGIVLILATQTVATLGGSWLVRLSVEAWRDRSLERLRNEHTRGHEELKAELSRLSAQLTGRIDHKVWVSRMQFDAEFAAVQRIWTALAEVRREIAIVRAPFDRRSEARSITERGNILGTSLRSLTVICDDVEPFIPAAIYEASLEARKVAIKEMSDLQGAIDGAPQDAEWHRRSMDHPQEFNRAVGIVAARMRERLGSLQIVHSED